MAGGDVLVDRLVAGGFVRPVVLLRGLQLRRPALSCWKVSLAMSISGLVAAHGQLPQAFEASRHRIPPEQLVDLPYETLISYPLTALQRIYDELGISSWLVAQAPMQARIVQARSYSADPVALSAKAQQRLHDLMEET